MNKWQRAGGISEVFWTGDKLYAFQRVGNVWRLYDGLDGFFIRNFLSFCELQLYIWHDKKEKEEKQNAENAVNG